MVIQVARYVYVNGAYSSALEAKISVFDRGVQFADSVYEVIAVLDGKFLDEALHLSRLSRSLRELKIKNPFFSDRSLKIILQDVLRKNRLRSALIYIQISRGAAPRSHAYAGLSLTPNIVITATGLCPEDLIKKSRKGLTVKTLPDLRRKRCDIKTTELLPNVMALVAANEAGFDDAILIDETGNVTECVSANLFLYRNNEGWITPPLDEKILPGVTRLTVIECMKARGEKITERHMTIDDVRSAQEAFLTSATKFVTLIRKIDDRNIPEKERSLALLSDYLQKFHLSIFDKAS